MASPGNPAYKDNWIRCNCCRTRRRTFQLLAKHYKDHPECRPCQCGGYHFAHTPRSPYCYQNPKAELRHALRRCENDEDVLDVLVDMAWGPGTPSNAPCPF